MVVIDKPLLNEWKNVSVCINSLRRTSFSKYPPPTLIELYNRLYLWYRGPTLWIWWKNDFLSNLGIISNSRGQIIDNLMISATTPDVVRVVLSEWPVPCQLSSMTIPTWTAWSGNTHTRKQPTMTVRGCLPSMPPVLVPETHTLLILNWTPSPLRPGEGSILFPA